MKNIMPWSVGGIMIPDINKSTRQYKQQKKQNKKKLWQKLNPNFKSTKQQNQKNCQIKQKVRKFSSTTKQMRLIYKATR